MKTIARYGTVLGVICVLAAGLLAAVNVITKPLIKFQAEQAEKKMLTEILPSCIRFEAVQSPDAGLIYYRAYDKQDKLAGFAFKSLCRGYSGTIETMAGLTLGGKITAVKILSHTETPGLGNRITEQEFTRQFSGKDILGLDSVLAITGATISSKAVMDSVKLRLQEIYSLIKDEK